MKIDYTGWNFFEELIKPYNNQYFYYNYGICLVEVKDIIGLSYKGVLDQEKLLRLHESIKKNGYQFRNYSDLHLVRFPNGKYSVCMGGNHRPYLAKKLGIRHIKANVDILIPKEMLSEEQLQICNDIEIDDLSNPKLKQICKELRLLPNQQPLKINIR
ncbi:hypothetical protein [Parageobacillus sp. G301]|uniref:hypothetical protein n=1 Tax=Anoxybacillaceae TaxID=3120669 RepID=UPI00078C2347|nr:hypothetical protein [Parageobacillus sp. G301]AMV11553.1 hypothetical protein GT3570_11530 [Geobacillus thermoleovorans]GLH62382.1 hypothetical protein PG301_02220 [Parageobacillus sp. G301]